MKMTKHGLGKNAVVKRSTQADPTYCLLPFANRRNCRKLKAAHDLADLSRIVSLSYPAVDDEQQPVRWINAHERGTTDSRQIDHIKSILLWPEQLMSLHASSALNGQPKCRLSSGEDLEVFQKGHHKGSGPCPGATVFYADLRGHMYLAYIGSFRM